MIDQETEGRLLNIMHHIFSPLKKSTPNTPHIYIGYEYDTNDVFSIQFDHALNRITLRFAQEYEGNCNFRLRELMHRITGRLEDDLLEKISFAYGRSENWRLDWTPRNLQLFSDVVSHHMEMYAFPESQLASIEHQEIILNEIRPSCYYHLMVASLIATTTGNPIFGKTLQYYFSPPEKFMAVYGYLPQEKPFPYFEEDLIDVLGRAYSIDTVMARRVYNDLRLGLSISYLKNVSGIESPELHLMDKVIDMRPMTAPTHPYALMATELCHNLDFIYP